jgi:hypothetical protein
MKVNGKYEEQETRGEEDGRSTEIRSRDKE